MIDHLGITTTPELHKSTIAFYTAALQPIGYSVKFTMFDGKLVALSCTNEGIETIFGLATTDTSPETGPSGPTQNVHYAFKAKDRKTVDECYAKGMEAGGKDHGAPGMRTHYHPNYYGAFMFDPLGNNMEIVCHNEEK